VSSRTSHTARLLVTAGVSTLTFGSIGFAILGSLEGLEPALGRLASLRPGPAVGAVAVWALSPFAQGYRLRALLPVRERPGGPEAAWLLLGGNALNLTLPGPVGEFASAWFLRQRHGVPMPAALAAGLLGRALALAVFGAVTVVLWPFAADGLPASVAGSLGPIAIATGLLTVPLAWLCVRPLALLRLADAVISRLVVVPALAGPVGRIQARVRWWARCFAAVGAVSFGRWAEAAGWSLVNLAILTTSTLLTLASAGIEADPLGTLFMQAITAVASVAGMLVPGGFGAVEILIVALFPVFAVGTTADAVFAAVALRAVHIVTLTLGVPAMGWLAAALPGEPVAMQRDVEAMLEAELGR
jgi:hypothetical protein